MGGPPCRWVGESSVCLGEALWTNVGRESPEMGQERRKSPVSPEPVSLPRYPKPAEHHHRLQARVHSGPLGAALNSSAQQRVLSGLDRRQISRLLSGMPRPEDPRQGAGVPGCTADVAPFLCVPRPLPTMGSTLGRRSSFGSGSAWGSSASPPTTSTARAASSSSRPATASSTVGTEARMVSW